MKIKTKLRLSFGSCVAILMLVIALGYLGLVHMRSQVTQVIERDTQVIANSHQIMKLIVDMETGERGFVITGRDEYLEPYHNALAKLDALLADQRDLVADEPDQLERLDRIESLVNDWQAQAGSPEIQARRIIADRQSHEAHMRSLVLSGNGKATFDELRQTIEPMHQTFEDDGNVVAVRALLEFEKAMIDQETGQRGYLLTGQEEFLEPFESGGTDAVRSLALLQEIIDTAHDRDATREDTQALHRQFKQWLDESGNSPGSTASEAQYSALVDRLNNMADRFEAAQNDTLKIAAAQSLVHLGGVAQIRWQQDKTADSQAPEELAPSAQAFSQSVDRIAAVNAQAYDITAMQNALDALKAIADRWLNASALPEIQARRNMDAFPETLTTLANKLAHGKGKEILDEIRSEIDLFIQIENEHLDQRVAKTSAYVTMATRAGLAIGLGALILACLFATAFTRMIGQPITRLSEGLDAISRGDRGLRVEVASRDEIGQLAGSFNKLAGQLLALEERQVLTDALSEAKDKAEAANRAKSEFLANMSHEIRTPMNAILGFADLLSEETLSQADRDDYTQTIRRSGDHLMRLINDILDLSKIEAEKMDVESIPTSPTILVSDVASSMRGKAQSSGIKLETQFTDAMPDIIHTDPVRLRQILLNLLGNAIKFTEQGTVKLIVTHVPNETTGLSEMGFEVIDSGIGISEEQMKKLFKPFSQADESTTRRFGGTGLGLTLSQRFAQMLGGAITVKSTPGQGSAFRLSMQARAEMADAHDASPQANNGHTPLPVAPVAQQVHARVLLAEDGPDNQRLILFHLKKMGMTATLAENGKIAADLALAERERGTPFDLILMDMQMPVMDGYSATKHLRKMGYTGPIVALTAHAMSGDRERCLDAGCDEYTTKPIEKIALQAMIVSLIEQRRAA